MAQEPQLVCQAEWLSNIVARSQEIIMPYNTRFSILAWEKKRSVKIWLSHYNFTWNIYCCLCIASAVERISHYSFVMTISVRIITYIHKWFLVPKYLFCLNPTYRLLWHSLMSFGTIIFSCRPIFFTFLSKPWIYLSASDPDYGLSLAKSWVNSMCLTQTYFPSSAVQWSQGDSVPNTALQSCRES